MTPLCETVTGRSMAELLAARDAATARPTMVELRLDGVANLDVARALHGRRVPAVVTCRAMWEGGRFDGTEDERRAILAGALDLGAEFVDVEWRAVEGQSTASPFGTSSSALLNALSCRRTTSMASPRIWNRARGRCGRRAPARSRSPYRSVV